MKNKKFTVLNILEWILMVFLVGIFLFFILGQVLLPKENSYVKGNCKEFQAEWSLVQSDGSRIPANIPGENPVPEGEWGSVETILPNIDGDTWLCFRSLQHDFKIYVGNELRKEYSTLDTQLFGETSTTAYVMVKIENEDSGKNLRVDYMSDSFYSGFMSEVYIGDKSDILFMLVRDYAPSTVLAVFMLILGLSVAGGSLLIKMLYKKSLELGYLGLSVVMTSMWLISESKLRQFILPNSTVAMHMGFFLIMLLPYPVLFYVNRIQKGRYQKLCGVILTLAILNFITCTLLQVLGIKDFFRTMTSSHLILVATIIFIFAGIIRDIIQGYITDYKPVAIGFAGFLGSSLIEVAMSYIVSAKYNGIPLSLGLVFLLMTAVVKAGKDLLEMEREKNVAVDASEAKAMFLAHMSHEIRTPINAVLGMNEMILRENTDPVVKEYATNAKSAGQMLLGLVNNILDYSKIEAGKLELVMGEYIPVTMIKSVIIGQQPRADEKGIKLEYENSDNLPGCLCGDELRIKQILNNILSNAVKYTEKGSVSVALEGKDTEQGFMLVVKVTDTGIGIREEDLHKLYDSFQRLELVKTRNIEGTGLGLNITKQLVNMMGGTISVSSEYGKGTSFCIELPQEVVDSTPYIEKEAANVSDTKTEEIKESNDTEHSKDNNDIDQLYAKGVKILAVDDIPMNLVLIKAFMKKSGAVLELANGGQEAVEKTKKVKYDLILMDHMMPEIDGIQALGMIKNDDENLNKDTKVIMLTANAIEGADQEYLKEGFVDYLSKPFEATVFESMIKKHI